MTAIVNTGPTSGIRELTIRTGRNKSAVPSPQAKPSKKNFHICSRVISTALNPNWDIEAMEGLVAQFRVASYKGIDLRHHIDAGADLESAALPLS